MPSAISTSGTILRTHISSIPVLGRATVGVTVIKIDRDSENRVASFAAVPEEEEEETPAEENAEGEGSEGAAEAGKSEGAEALEGAEAEASGEALDQLNEANDVARLLERAEEDREAQEEESSGNE